MEGLHVIFDGNNTAYRANAVTELYTKQGIRTSAIIGTLNITHAMLVDLPNLFEMPVKEVIYAWDGGKSKRRLEVFPEYKANRKREFTPEDKQWFEEFMEQMRVLQDNLCLFGVKSFWRKGWEGDDIVYAVCRVLKKQTTDPICIVSTDEDFHQLISTNIAVYSPIKKVLYTSDNYKEKMGIDLANYLSYRIIKGDTSDGIPGVDGIGEKTAKTLVNTYGDIGSILSHKADLMKSKRTARIFTMESLMRLNRNNRLINLADYVDTKPIESDVAEMLGAPIEWNGKAVRAFMVKYQLLSLLEKFNTWSKPFVSVVDTYEE